MQERRCTSRWQINRQTEVKLEGAEAFASCTIRDINLKGMQVCLAMKLPRDKFIKFCIFLHKKFALEVEAWVVWQKTITNENRCGIYFTKIKDHDKERIYRFVCEHYPGHLTKCWWGAVTEEKGGEQMEDHRIFNRIPVKFPLRFLDVNTGKDGLAQMQDISAKGIGMLANTELAQKSSLELWLEIPDKGEPLYARGDVVWSQMVAPDKFRVGVNLEKADLMGLSRVLRTAQ